MLHAYFDMAVAWVVAHPTTSAIAACWLFSNAVSAMPTPTDKQGPLYHWFFDFSHTLAGNAMRVVATRFPNSFLNALNGASSAEQSRTEAPVPPSK